MVLAGLAFQPELWAAGLESVGISSFVTFLENTSPYRRAAREREYGSLEHDRDFLIEASPITHVDAIRAPLFIQHGANDPRVPLSGVGGDRARAAREGRSGASSSSIADEGHTDRRSSRTGSTRSRGWSRSSTRSSVSRRPGTMCAVAAPWPSG